jgi:hypothetical protein
VWPEGISEHDRAFLIGLVIRVPVIVHGVGVERPGRTDRRLPGAHAFVSQGLVRERADFDEGRVEADQRHPGSVVRHVGRILKAEEILARAFELVGRGKEVLCRGLNGDWV